MKSPFDITYQDLITSTEKQLAWMEKNYPRMISEKRMNDYAARKAIEIEKQKLKLFRKYKRDPQTDLFQEFNK